MYVLPAELCIARLMSTMPIVIVASQGLCRHMDSTKVDLCLRRIGRLCFALSNTLLRFLKVGIAGFLFEASNHSFLL